jgi:hypothetical protein
MTCKVEKINTLKMLLPDEMSACFLRPVSFFRVGRTFIRCV